MSASNPEPSSQLTARPRRFRWRWPVLIVVGIVLFRGALMFGVTPPPVGLVDGHLRPCPSSPNCVCSQANDAGHAIEPLHFSDDAQFAWMRLKVIIEGLPRTKIVKSDDGYLHAEFTTALLRFVDDVEFQLAADRGVIDVRSASRVGHSDLGANRKRVEMIRKLFESDLQIPPLSGQAIPPAGSRPESP